MQFPEIWCTWPPRSISRSSSRCAWQYIGTWAMPYGPTCVTLCNSIALSIVGPPPNVCSNGCVMLCGLCRPLWPDSLCCKATDKTYHLACRTHLLSTSSCLSRPNTGLVEGFLFSSRIQCWILHHKSVYRNFIPETSFAFADIGVNLRPIVEESIRGEM